MVSFSTLYSGARFASSFRALSTAKCDKWSLSPFPPYTHYSAALFQSRYTIYKNCSSAYNVNGICIRDLLAGRESYFLAGSEYSTPRIKLPSAPSRNPDAIESQHRAASTFLSIIAGLFDCWSSSHTHVLSILSWPAIGSTRTYVKYWEGLLYLPSTQM